MASPYRKLFIAWIALAGLAGLILIRPGLRPALIDYEISGDRVSQFSWADVIPSDELEWSDCYSGHQCARLNVPLNHSEPDGDKAAIAITRYPAAVPAGSPLYRGPILFNPGGPGGSGVDFIANAGSALAQIIGPAFDIVGFDPRGIAHSTPRVSFFETDVERYLWGNPGLTDVNASSDALGRFWARAQIYNSVAAKQASFLQHINTDNTARDMLRIVRAHGMEKLQYWGFPYGSVLGAVFAAIFPDKVERIIIDGVVDAENYFDALWSNNLLDADKALQTFFDGCAAAGPEGCAFYAPTPEAISQNLTALFESVLTRPIPLPTPATPSGYLLVDLNLLRLIGFITIYFPQLLFAPVAESLAALAAIARGEASQFDASALVSALEPCPCDPSEPQFNVIPDAQVAIICNDGRAVPPGFAEAEEHYQSMVKTSSWGSLLASIRIMCSGWPDVPKKHFQGPVTGNTSVPMLIIGNTADPVTSLWAAKKTSKAFPGSVVLTQDCTGHTSLAAPSPCTWGHIREYFYNGTLPDKDTVCPVLGSPFPDRRLQEQDETLSTAQRVFSAFKAVQPWSRAPRFVL
ncbi:TAP-like protein-domain-containing protein [Mycena capillaripes]|nr:TAP-like protein-domain-containing protein [Mycena capillaripes]